MRKYILFFLSFLWFFIEPSTTVAAEKFHSNYYFKQISIKEGLTQSRVQCVLIDNKGYIWIGTESGLNCLEHYNLKKYVHSKEDASSLPSNNIHFIAEDSLCNLWIATEKGLTYYNRSKDNFTRIYQGDKPLYACSYLLIPDGILFGSKGMFYKYRYKDKSIRAVWPKHTQEETHNFYQIHFLTPNIIIANTRWYGVYTYNTRTNELKKLNQFNKSDYSTLFVDSRKNFWIASYGEGIYCYTSSGKLVSHFSSSNSGLKNNAVLAFEERDNKLWIATDGGGINILSLDDHSFEYIEHIADDVNSLPSNSFYCIYNDTRNNMWMGSIRDGLIGIKEVHIKTFKNVPTNNPYGLSNKTVVSIYQDQERTIWIGTDGGGINKYNSETNKFTHYPSTNQAKITSITELNNKELLLSLFNQGLYVFNKQTGSYRKLTIINEEIDKNICISAYTINISKISSDKVVICTDKIYLYHIKDNTFSVVSEHKDRKPYKSIPLICDSLSTYLIEKTTIYRWIHATNQVTAIYDSKEKGMIYDACLDHQGNIWIGGTFGLIQFNPQTGKSHKVSTLLFSEVTSLIADKQGRIWIGTWNMLFSYSIANGHFVILGESDGIISNEYISKSNLISQSGDIYMGGSYGMSRISKDIQFKENSLVGINLSEILLNGAQLNKEEQTINIPWNFTSLIIKVVPKENDVFQTYAYRYSISGMNRQAIQSYDPNFSIYYLPIGKYKVFVSYNSKEGGWTTPIELITIQVTPPWWQTAWFRLFITILVIGFMFTITHYIVKKKRKRQKRELEHFKQKTYEEKVRFLININHELRTPLTLIYAPLKRILNKNIEDKELNEQLTGVYRQAKRMKNIINMVLDIRRMEVTKEPLHLSFHAFNEWVLSISDDFNNEFKAKDIKLMYRFDKSIEKVPYDQTKCEIILSNLLINALKFSEPNSCVIVSTQLHEDRQMVRLSVTDNGIGLKGVDIDKLFTRFYQGIHEHTGSGIGLSYAKNLIEMQGGSIGAKNNEEKGACFFFELPLSSTIKADLTQREYLNELYCKLPEIATVEVLSIDTNNYSLLIAEDEDELRKFIKESLKEYFHSIYTAKNGKEALDMILQHQPDVVVSDVMMPMINGFELCKCIKENLEISHIPVVLLTALNDAENTINGYKLGADAYLSKPFEIDYLQTVIGNLLKNREKVKVHYKSKGSINIAKELTFSNADEQFLLNLHEIIQQNISDTELNVDTLAQKIGVSRSLLFNKIKALTNMGIIDYVNKMRVENACVLLLHSDKNITEISEEVGFSTQRYFSKVFKQIKEVTPSQFKQNKL